jgi:hypothetical protein
MPPRLECGGEGSSYRDVRIAFSRGRSRVQLMSEWVRDLEVPVGVRGAHSCPFGRRQRRKIRHMPEA